jgi:hypothetical protein
MVGQDFIEYVLPARAPWEDLYVALRTLQAARQGQDPDVDGVRVLIARRVEPSGELLGKPDGDMGINAWRDHWQHKI